MYTCIQPASIITNHRAHLVLVIKLFYKYKSETGIIKIKLLKQISKQIKLKGIGKFSFKTYLQSLNTMI